MARLRFLLVPPFLLPALLLRSSECASLSSSSSSSSSVLRGFAGSSHRASDGKLLLEKPRLAMCISGNLRTFNATAPSIRPFLHNLQGVGLTSEQPDVFLYGTLASASAKNQTHYSYAPLDVSKAAAKKLVQGLQPTAYKLVEEAGEVDTENLHRYVNSRQCFRSGFWQGEKNLIRSMNQLAHLQSCVDLVLANEEKHGQRYDAVILARPDLLYEVKENETAPLLQRASQGVFVFQWDWFMLMPRHMLARLLDPSIARPLTCTSGQVCCGRVKSSEDMFEYIFGASTRKDSGTCACSPIKTESYKVTVARLERTEFLK